MKQTKIVIYTDGAYSRKNNIGGYAFIVQCLKFNNEHEIYELIKEASDSQSVLNTTSNRMELQAAIDGLNFIKKPCSHIELISDSTYVVNTINDWIWTFIGQPGRLNYDLLHMLHKAIIRHGKVEAKWVKGHSSDIRNNRVNELAQRAAGTWTKK